MVAISALTIRTSNGRGTELQNLKILSCGLECRLNIPDNCAARSIWSSQSEPSHRSPGSSPSTIAADVVISESVLFLQPIGGNLRSITLRSDDGEEWNEDG